MKYKLDKKYTISRVELIFRKHIFLRFFYSLDKNNCNTWLGHWNSIMSPAPSTAPKLQLLFYTFTHNDNHNNF